MIKEKISSQEIIDLVASKASVSKRAAEEFLKVMITSIEEALLAGEVVKIKNFGTFKLQWNEPRKSVNIQSGAEIILSGYYKVAFTPDTMLKEQVNEPFAHLVPVELDVEIKKDEQEEGAEIASDPLRIFTEQAFEIKNLIFEIQALSDSKSATSEAAIGLENITEEKTVNDVIEDERAIKSSYNEDDLDMIEVENPKIPERAQDLSTEDIENPAIINLISPEDKESKLISDLSVTPYLENIKPTKKRKIWMWILIILFSLSSLWTCFYFIYPPVTELTRETIANSQYSVNKIAENMSISEIVNSISKWFTSDAKPANKPVTIVIPKDTNDFDSIKQNQLIDSLQYLFDNPLVYREFVATERINEGSRLTLMSKRYYGTKDFWVYIYEANKERIPNPDKIAVGTLIRIPKLDSRLIDATNPRCLKKARELHDIYVK
ncbi:MAG: HU family DNA-binding protein [Bacteroidota bacterium]|nr:HU family DNA-binding protein [Bacteroidota bacterium]